MAYNKTVWENDKTPVNADNMNKIEQGIADAHELLDGIDAEGVIQAGEKAAAAAQTADEAAKLAKAAAETALTVDQAGSVIDVIQKTPIFFGSGTAEEIEAAADTIPDGAMIFNLADTASAGLVAGVYGVYSEEELEEVINAIYTSMAENTMRHVVIADHSGQTPIGGGNSHFTIYKTNENYGLLEAQKYDADVRSKNTRTLWDGVWQPWRSAHPKMYNGVEYRTMEQWNGDPVFTMFVDVGYLANTGSAAVGVGIPAENVVSFDVVAHNAENKVVMSMPMISETGAILARTYYQDGYLFIQSFADMSGYTAVCIFKYTKS